MARGFGRLAGGVVAGLALMAAAVALRPAASLGQPAPVVCPDGHPMDGIHRLGDAKSCLVVRKRDSETGAAAPVVAVYLHGDGGGRTEMPAESGASYNLWRNLRIPVIAVQRPGYRSALGVSDGYTNPGDDDYTEGNLAILARALRSLRQFHPEAKILLIGFSGGSAMTALTASRYPDAADGYLVAGCPCDIDAWRAWRNQSAGRRGLWQRSLSPQQEAGKVPPGTFIRLIVGAKDDNTLPKFSEAYVQALRQRGVATELTVAEGATHSTITRSPQFFALAAAMVRRLERPGRTAENNQ